jgi:hypothetical protein
MKYLAICFLSLAASLTARPAPMRPDAGATLAGPQRAVHIAAPREDNTADRALAGALGAALVALQLRRRQKSLTLPRPLF